jgi:very-short-patch-repair endonuclease
MPKHLLIYGDKMSKYENKVMELFKKAKLPFYREKTFKDLKHGLFRFDFYLPNYCGAPVIVEVDGEQHFKPIYGRQAFLKGQEHDRQKNSYCLAKNILLFRIPYWEIAELKSIDDIFIDKHLVKTRWHNDNLREPH